MSSNSTDPSPRNRTLVGPNSLLYAIFDDELIACIKVVIDEFNNIQSNLTHPVASFYIDVVDGVLKTEIHDANSQTPARRATLHNVYMNLVSNPLISDDTKSRYLIRLYQIYGLSKWLCDSRTSNTQTYQDVLLTALPVLDASTSPNYYKLTDYMKKIMEASAIISNVAANTRLKDALDREALNPNSSKSRTDLIKKLTKLRDTPSKDMMESLAKSFINILTDLDNYTTNDIDSLFQYTSNVTSTISIQNIISVKSV